MKKIVFTIFAMPDEIDNLERLLFDFNKSSKFVDGSNYGFYVTMATDEYLFDWKYSLLKKQIYERYN